MTALKRIIFISFIFMMPALAWAGSPFLEISATNTFRSGERAAVEAAIAQAEAENKFVLIEISAGWCGPCLWLDQQMEARKAEVEANFSRFVYVKLEQMHFESETTDFLGFDPFWYPSFVIYNPSTAKWNGLDAGSNLDGVFAEVSAFLNNSSLGDFHFDRVLAGLRSGKVTPGIWQAFHVASGEYDGAKYLTVLKEIVGFMTSNPALLGMPVADLRDELMMSHLRVISMGKLTRTEIESIDPEAFVNLAANDYANHDLAFYIPLSIVARTQGNFAAADQCDALSQAAEAIMAGTPYEAEAREVRKLSCMKLYVQTGRMTAADLIAFTDTLSEQRKLDLDGDLMRLFAASGDFTNALIYAGTWKATFDKNFADDAEMYARVSKATAEVVSAYQAGKTHP